MGKTIEINGGTYEIGTPCFSQGSVPETPAPIVVTLRILEWNDEENYYIAEEDGYKFRGQIRFTMWDGSPYDERKHLWTNTAENYKYLKDLQDSEHNRWVEACRKQLASVRAQ